MTAINERLIRIKDSLTARADRDALSDAVNALILADKALHFYADFFEVPNDGPWGAGSEDFGAVATKALQDINSLTGAK